MSAHQTLTIPSKSPIRTEVFAFRVTPDERQAIFEFARRLGLPASEVARHYLLQAAALYEQTSAGERINGTD